MSKAVRKGIDIFMSGYGSLAQYYDDLTEDVNYQSFADFYEKIFEINRIKVNSIVDLACGTGTLTAIMAERGYDMTGVDMSGEMLVEAVAKNSEILYLNQSLDKLDLYGTYDSAICCLDGINYCSPETIPVIFHRVSLFINPGGIFVFDILPPEYLKKLDGEVWVDEKEDVCCLWRSEFDIEDSACYYGIDIFAKRSDGLYNRQSEEHIEYAHSVEMIKNELMANGFEKIRIYGDRNDKVNDTERIFISAIRSEEE